MSFDSKKLIRIANYIRALRTQAKQHVEQLMLGE